MKKDCPILSIAVKNPGKIKSGMITNRGLVSTPREYAGYLNGVMWNGVWFNGHEGSISETKLIPHHLYVLSKENIHGDEWYVLDGELHQMKRGFPVIQPPGALKIMATTNTSLEDVPLIQRSFVKRYFKRLYYGKTIDVLSVEVEYWDDDMISTMLHCDAKLENGFAMVDFKD